MARYIAGALFNVEGLAAEDNWKVKNLLKSTKPALEDLMELAVKARLSGERKPLKLTS